MREARLGSSGRGCVDDTPAALWGVGEAARGCRGGVACAAGSSPATTAAGDPYGVAGLVRGVRTNAPRRGCPGSRRTRALLPTHSPSLSSRVLVDLVGLLPLRNTIR